MIIRKLLLQFQSSFFLPSFFGLSDFALFKYQSNCSNRRRKTLATLRCCSSRCTTSTTKFIAGRATFFCSFIHFYFSLSVSQSVSLTVFSRPRADKVMAVSSIWTMGSLTGHQIKQHFHFHVNFFVIYHLYICCCSNKRFLPEAVLRF